MRFPFARRLAAGLLLLGLGAGPVLADGAGLATTLYDERGKALGTTANPLTTTGGGGGSGGTVAQGAAGTSPWPAVVAQYNATLPTLTSGVTAYLAVDSNGRLIQSPGASVTVSNFPASQPVTNAGTFAVQNTAAVVGGNAAAVKTDSSATTQPVSAAALPLPAGAATAANQAATQSAPGTSATTADTIQGSATGVPVRIQAAQWWTEFSGVANAASASNLGAARSTGSTTGVGGPFAYFIVNALSTTSGTLYAYCGSENVSSTVSANVMQTIKIPAFATGCQGQFVNGGTAGTLTVLTDGYTVN